MENGYYYIKDGIIYQEDGYSGETEKVGVAKWKEHCCEYMHVEGVGYCSSGCGGYAHDYMLASEWIYCPHCGKPIRISEVTT